MTGPGTHPEPVVPAEPADDATRQWLDLALIDSRVTDLRPDYTALIIVAYGLRPGPSDQAADALLSDAEAAACAMLAGRAAPGSPTPRSGPCSFSTASPHWVPTA